VFDLVRPRGGASDVVEAIAATVEPMAPDCRLGVCGNSEKAGDFMGCGEVALRCRVFSIASSVSILSLMVLSFSRVACRRSSSDDLVPFGFNTPLNMTLYRSSLISGISTLRNPALPVETEGPGFERPGELGSWAAGSGRSVVGLITIGVCFGAFLPATVLLLAGARSSLDPDEALRLTSAASTTFGGSACFLPPNSEPNSLLFCVFVLRTAGSGVCTGEVTWLI
jgi:hypothetical protein